MSQTSHPRKQGVALAGQMSDLTHSNRDSFCNVEASAEIPFGTMVARATGGAEQLDAGDDNLVGIVIRDHAYDIPNELGDTGLKPTVVMTVLSKGRIWVPVEEAVTDLSGPVRVRHTVTGNEVPGAFRTTADSTDCIDCSAFARWIGASVTSNGATLAEVEIFGNFNAAIAD